VVAAAADTVADWDHVLWLAMIASGIAAAGVSIAATCIDRRTGRQGQRVAFFLHIASYILMSISILMFALRGLIGAS
jgi:hypothetical protein